MSTSEGEDMWVIFFDYVQDLESVIDIGSEASGDTYSVWFERGKLLVQTGFEAHIQ